MTRVLDGENWMWLLAGLMPGIVAGEILTRALFRWNCEICNDRIKKDHTSNTAGAGREQG